MRPSTSSAWHFVLSIFAFCCFGPRGVFGQTTAVSNLGQTFNANLIASDVYADGIDFTTGANGGTLVSVTVPFKSFGTSPGGFNLSLYSGLTSSGATGLITTLTGTTPTNQASYTNYVFTPATATTLAASTTYWLVLTASASTNSSGYHWSAAATTADDAGALAGWSIGNLRWISSNAGSTWGTAAGVVPQFSVQVSAIPEPSAAIWLAATAAMAAAAIRRRRPGNQPGPKNPRQDGYWGRS